MNNLDANDDEFISKLTLSITCDEDPEAFAKAYNWQDCRPNPAYAEARARADRVAECRKRGNQAWIDCGGTSIEKYLVNNGLDMMKCRADFENR